MHILVMPFIFREAGVGERQREDLRASFGPLGKGILTCRSSQEHLQGALDTPNSVQKGIAARGQSGNPLSSSKKT